jgi:hypothetical protein
MEERMATPQDAELILKLYELRREEVMRKARQFVLGPEFLPQGVEDVKAVLADPQKSAYFRQATSYWEMAAALVNHGALDAGLFFDTNGEYLAIWAKLGDLMPQLRESVFGPQAFRSLETLIRNQPNSEAYLERFRERYRQMAAARAAQKAD